MHTSPITRRNTALATFIRALTTFYPWANDTFF